MVLKLLLIAPACDGEDVGEAWDAYQWASRLAGRYELTVLTYHKRGRTPARAKPVACGWSNGPSPVGSAGPSG